MAEHKSLTVRAVYAVVDPPVVKTLQVISGASVSEVIAQANFPAMQSEHREDKSYAVGIYGRPVTGDTLVQDGDRVEIYAPLKNTPEEARRRRL